MERARVARVAVRVYVALLLVGAAVTTVWLFGPQVVTSPMVASAWFTVGAFGVLVFAMLVLMHYARKN